MVLYPNKNVDTGDIKHYREFFTSQRIRRIYLDELGEAASLPIGTATAKLVIADDDVAIAKAWELIDRTKSEISSPQKHEVRDDLKGKRLERDVVSFIRE